MSKLEFNQLSQKIRFKKRSFNFTENQVSFLKTAIDSESKLMFLAGPAGTAKTYMAVYSALQMMIDSGLEKDILYIRSIAESADRSIGSLPGSIEEKFGVFASPFYDKLHEMLNVTDIKMLKEKRQFDCIPVNFVRGANWNDTIVIVDEAQNLTPHEVKTIITRAGEGTKIVFTGDINQIDHPYLDKKSNGVSYLINRMEKQKIFSHINLKKGERSELAELASNLL